MTIEANQLSIKFLFEQSHTFEVPKYQRGYAWDDEAVDDFIEDMNKCLNARLSDTPKSHFFGGIVTVRKPVTSSNRSNFEVIDGQQRLTSFVMLIAAIKHTARKIIGDLSKIVTPSVEESKAKSFLESTEETLNNTYLSYKDEIDLEYVEIPKLKLSKADNDFFQEILNGLTPNPDRSSHQRIQSAWKKLLSFSECTILCGSDASEKAKRLQAFVNSVMSLDYSVIFMCSGSRSEAYQIFQVLNDRGVHLTDGDLLRARTLELLENQTLVQNKVADRWDNVLSYPPADINNYFRWYFSSWEGKRPKSSNLSDQFIESRFKCTDVESADNSKAQDILEEVKSLDNDFTTLRTLGDGEWPYTDNSLVDTWDRERLRMLVTHLKHTNTMPLLLSLSKLDGKVFAEAVSCIERFVFRFKTIGNAHITPMTALYLKHAKLIRETENYKVSWLRKDLSELVLKKIPDEIFEANLHQMLQYSPKGGNGHIKYMLITLEDYTQWYEDGFNGVPKCKDKSQVFDFSNTTLEHIYPGSSQASGIDSDMEKVKHKLGNLTLLGPSENDKLANKPFEEKKPYFAKSNLQLNRDIAEYSAWNEDAIESREKLLIKKALKTFIP